MSLKLMRKQIALVQNLTTEWERYDKLASLACELEHEIEDNWARHMAHRAAKRLCQLRDDAYANRKSEMANLGQF